MARHSDSRRGVRLTAILIAMTLVAAGCDDSGETESFSDPVSLGTTSTASAEAELIEDIVAELSTAAPIPAREDQFRCAAEAAVAAVGVDRLIAAGVPAQGTFDGTLLDAPGQTALIQEIEGCRDIGSLLGDGDRMGVAVPPQAAACIADSIERTGIFETIVRAAGVSGPDQAIVDNIVPIIETLAGCLTVLEVAALVDALGLTSFLPGS